MLEAEQAIRGGRVALWRDDAHQAFVRLEAYDDVFSLSWSSRWGAADVATFVREHGKRRRFRRSTAMPELFRGSFTARASAGGQVDEFASCSWLRSANLHGWTGPTLGWGAASIEGTYLRDFVAMSCAYGVRPDLDDVIERVAKVTASLEARQVQPEEAELVLVAGTVRLGLEVSLPAP